MKSVISGREAFSSVGKSGSKFTSDVSQATPNS